MSVSTSGSFYQDVQTELCQGDIIDGVPNIHLKPPIQGLRPATASKNRQVYEFHEFGKQSAGFNPDYTQGVKVPAFCQVSRVMLLTHGCDIDNDPDHRTVALIRPLARVPEDRRVPIRNNQNFGFFYLPPDPNRGLDEAYVDLRRLTCLAPDLVTSGRRLASLTATSVDALHFQLFRFFTRRDPSPAPP
jgi:hypothetical protein